MREFDYVAGFAFDEKKERVLLIEKQKPEWQKGFLNGIGGKVETGESLWEAQMREFKEETGLLIPEANWNFFCSLNGSDERGNKWRVRFLWAIGNIDHARRIEDEMPMIRPVNDLGKVIPNLNWLVPMALSMPEENCVYFYSEER